jgi:hypothetical protein
MLKWEKFTKEQIEEIINTSNSNKEVAEKLGYSWKGAAAGGAAIALKKMYDKLDLHPIFLLENNLIGQRFGFLTIIDYIKSPPDGGKHPSVVCKCKCGNIKTIRLQHLRGTTSGDGYWFNVISCGCAKSSAGEIRLEALLYEHKINFQSQYRLNDFNPQASFDFAIFNQKKEIIYLIEYDGEQHFKSIGHWGGDEQFKLQQQRDENKNKYCREHNLELIRIPYTDFKLLSWNYLVNKMPKLTSVDVIAA